MPEPNAERLDRQLAFLREIDRLKEVERRTWLLSGARHENSAEHSWHLAIMALLLADQANEPIALARVLPMLLVHDLVEIDAGDTYIYDAPGMAAKAERERAAAERIFGLLPEDQAAWLWSLWTEFEHGDTPEARFARALDRLQPLLHNVYTRGRAWREHGTLAADVYRVNGRMAEGAAPLWEHARRLLDEAVARGDLAE